MSDDKKNKDSLVQDFLKRILESSRKNKNKTTFLSKKEEEKPKETKIKKSIFVPLEQYLEEISAYTKHLNTEDILRPKNSFPDLWPDKNKNIKPEDISSELKELKVPNSAALYAALLQKSFMDKIRKEEREKN